MKNLLSIYILALVLVGCALTPSQISPPIAERASSEVSIPQPAATAQSQPQLIEQISERNRELALRLTIATKKAEGELKYGNGFKDSAEIILYLQKKHSRLYAEFNKTTLKFSLDDGHVLGLVCDAETGFAVAEDSPCTPEADVTYGDTNAPCAFTLSSQTLCSK